MENAHLLVATDFTEAAAHALHFAGLIAQRSADPIALLHVKNRETARLLQPLGHRPEDLDAVLGRLCDEIRYSHQVECEPVVREGRVLDQILKAAVPPCRLLLIGTHGTHGLRQSLFGPDMLHIARKAQVPVLAVPDHARQHTGFRTIVFPYGSHPRYENKIRATVQLARWFGAEVHLYALDRPGESFSDACLQNVAAAKEAFDQAGIPYREVHEEPQVFSPGFAQQTIEYAHRVGAELIAVMSVPSAEYSYISKADKEQLINNEHGLAILMCGDYHDR